MKATIFKLASSALLAAAISGCANINELEFEFGIAVDENGKPTISIEGKGTIEPDQPEVDAEPPGVSSDTGASTEKSRIADGIFEAAEELGVSPLDLATIISYETAGSFDPLKRGPTTQWGQHRGLIQFGVPQAQQFGVDWAKPIASQLGVDGAVVKYMRNAGVKPGHGLLDLYSAVNAGYVGRYSRTDENNGGAPGTVRDKVNRMASEGHVANAKRHLAHTTLYADKLTSE